MKFKIFQFNNSYVDGEYTVKDGTMNIRYTVVLRVIDFLPYCDYGSLNYRSTKYRNLLRERGDLVSFEGMDRLRKSWWSNEEVR